MAEAAVITELPTYMDSSSELGLETAAQIFCKTDISVAKMPQDNRIEEGKQDDVIKSEKEEQTDVEVQVDGGRVGEGPPIGEDEPPGENDVVCDACIENPRKARKSCLTCLVSYCNAHLRPHLENAKFQSHRLVEPLRDVERRMCETHDSPLDIYCSTDGCCVCQECVTNSHEGHNTLPVIQARQNLEKELQEKYTQMGKTVIAAENSINKLQSNTKSVEECVHQTQAMLQEQFSDLLAALEKVQVELTQTLETEHQQTLRQAHAVQLHLVQHCAELKKTHAQLEKLSKNKNDVDFLQEYSQWKKASVDMSLPAVSISLTDRLQSFSCLIKDTTQKLCDTLQKSYRNTLKEVTSTDKTSVQCSVQDINAAKQSMSLPEPKTRDDFLKYASPLTFDSSTAHQFLRLTEDLRKVTNTTPWQHGYPEQPERFLHWKQVLATGSFYLGRHYFEVDVSGEGVHIGVAYKGIARESAESVGCLTGSEASWCLQWNGRHFSAWHAGEETPVSGAKATRLGVYVDYGRGLLDFYAVGEHMTLLHRYQTELVEPLHPACWLSKKENVVMLVQPGTSLPIKSPSPPCSPP